METFKLPEVLVYIGLVKLKRIKTKVIFKKLGEGVKNTVFNVFYPIQFKDTML